MEKKLKKKKKIKNYFRLFKKKLIILYFFVLYLLAIRTLALAIMVWPGPAYQNRTHHVNALGILHCFAYISVNMHATGFKIFDF